jgi:DNA-binding PucR family transcriptional regulator
VARRAPPLDWRTEGGGGSRTPGPTTSVASQDGGCSIADVEVDLPTVDERVSAAAAAVVARQAEVTTDIVALLTGEIEALRDDERVVALLTASVAENVATLLHVFQHGIDPASVETPTAAIEYARRLAQRGVPIIALIRAYRIGHARFLEWCFEELTGEDADQQGVSEATQRMAQLSFTYIDRISERVIDFYEQERDRWLHNRATVRAARVRALLAGDQFDLDATEASLGYRLRRQHLGLVVWIREPTRGQEELLVLERAAVRIAQVVGRGLPLFVPCDESSAWVWLPSRADRRVTVAQVAEAVADPGVRVEFGETGDGVEGFRRTHVQALRAHAVALAAAGAGAQVTAFADVRPIALMTSDLEATRSWVLDTLGALAIDDEQHARLRNTLRVFLATGGSYTTTADRLTMHKNTVHYRVGRAEEIRGRPIKSDRLDVELALLACESLGPAVLRPVDV